MANPNAVPVISKVQRGYLLDRYLVYNRVNRGSFLNIGLGEKSSSLVLEWKHGDMHHLNNA